MKATAGANTNRFNEIPSLAPIKKKLARTISMKHFLKRPEFKEINKYGFSDFDYSPKYNLVQKKPPIVAFTKTKLGRNQNKMNKRSGLGKSLLDLNEYWNSMKKGASSFNYEKNLGRSQLPISNRDLIPFLEQKRYKQKKEGKEPKTLLYKKKRKTFDVPLEEIYAHNLSLLK